MDYTYELWKWLPIGYAITVAIELPVLLLGLSRRHPLKRRVESGFWLTLCTYPIVVLVLPPLLLPPFGRLGYLLVAETFAPLAECALFYFAFLVGVPNSRQESQRARGQTMRDFAAIVLANLLSFGPIEIARWQQWLEW